MGPRRVGSPLRVITSSRASKPVPEVEKDVADSGAQLVTSGSLADDVGQW